MFQLVRPAVLLSAMALATAACGSSGTPSAGTSQPPTSSSASTPAPAGTSSSPVLDVTGCPSASTVGSAFGGADLPAPTTVSGFSSALPAGATGIGCSYLSSNHDVIINLIDGYPASDFSASEGAVDSNVGHTLAFSPISGLGTEAVSYTWTSPIYGPAVGVIVQDGTSHVSVYAAGLSATVAQVTGLASQLLS